VRTRVQQVLLEGLGREPVHSVRRALADCVAATAQQAMPAGQWPSLLGFLHQCSKADVPELREVALLLFAALYEAGGAQASCVCVCARARACVCVCVCVCVARVHGVWQRLHRLSVAAVRRSRRARAREVGPTPPLVPPAWLCRCCHPPQASTSRHTCRP
jgi:hypothetical protein